MKIEYHPRATGGVTELMYIGDDGLPRKPAYNNWWAVAGGLAVAAWLLSRDNRRRRR